MSGKFVIVFYFNEEVAYRFEMTEPFVEVVGPFDSDWEARLYMEGEMVEPGTKGFIVPINAPEDINGGL